MAVRPSIITEAKRAAPPKTPKSDTAPWFVAGITEKGDIVKPIPIRSMLDYDLYLGGRVSYGTLYDALDTFFHEGGSLAWVCRVVGPAATTATLTLNDSGAVAVLKVDAKNPGAWGSNIKIAVTAGVTAGTFILTLTDATTAATLESSPELVDLDAAVNWSALSNFVNISKLAGTNDPNVLAATALVGGSDDRTNALDAHWKSAIDRATLGYGPGQVSYPGRTTTQAHTDLQLHADTNRRRALLDTTDTSTAATLTSAATNARGSGTYAYAAMMLAPWVRVPGVAAGTLRDVPPSAVVAGLIARNDLKGNANEPAAGVNGVCRYAVSLKNVWDITTYDSLNTAGVMTLREIQGTLRLYGYRSLVSAIASDQSYGSFNNSRLRMQIEAMAAARAENYILGQITRRNLAAWAGEIAGDLNKLYMLGALFGDTPEEAFSVDAGPAVNTVATMADRQMNVVINVRMSQFAELMKITIVNTPITEVI